jgi:hypothetical protein
VERPLKNKVNLVLIRRLFNMKGAHMKLTLQWTDRQHEPESPTYEQNLCLNVHLRRGQRSPICIIFILLFTIFPLSRDLLQVLHSELYERVACG